MDVRALPERRVRADGDRRVGLSDPVGNRESAAGNFDADIQVATIGTLWGGADLVQPSGCLTGRGAGGDNAGNACQASNNGAAGSITITYQ